MTAYLVASVVLFVFYQIIGGKKDGGYKTLRIACFIGWLISIPFCLVMVYLNAGTWDTKMNKNEVVKTEKLTYLI